ncbi:MAG: hypothetical protein AAGA93_22285, partial [Actinomycetota bacterium]
MITACNAARGQRPDAPGLRRLLPLLAGFLLVVSACGDDGDASEANASGSPTASGPATASASALEPDAASSGDAGDTADTDDDAADESTDDAAGGAYPVTIEHDLGTTTVPAAPERVVAMTDQGELAALLALDVRPIAYGQRIPGEVDYLAAEGAYDPGIEIFPSDVEINFERLTA